MTKRQALKLHNEDEVTVKATKDITTVLQSYIDKNGNTCIETTYNGFTVFRPDEIS